MMKVARGLLAAAAPFRTAFAAAAGARAAKKHLRAGGLPAALAWAESFEGRIPRLRPGARAVLFRLVHRPLSDRECLVRALADYSLAGAGATFVIGVGKSGNERHFHAWTSLPGERPNASFEPLLVRHR